MPESINFSQEQRKISKIGISNNERKKKTSGILKEIIHPSVLTLDKASRDKEFTSLCLIQRENPFL